MVWVDLAIVVVMVLAVVGGFAQGFLRSFCSLAGLVAGLSVGAWNYGRIAVLLLPLVHSEAVADTIGFLLIALLVMALAAVAGEVLSKAVHEIGLGCLDRIVGAVFGVLQGALMVTIVILVAVAVFPRAHWLENARLPRLFFRACNLSADVTPADLAERIRQGLKILEEETPRWLHPGVNGA